jgi:hypothetical protein
MTLAQLLELICTNTMDRVILRLRMLSSEDLENLSIKLYAFNTPPPTPLASDLALTFAKIYIKNETSLRQIEKSRKGK